MQFFPLRVASKIWYFPFKRRFQKYAFQKYGTFPLSVASKNMLQYQILIKIQGHRVIMTDQVKKADKKANKNSDKKADKKTEARAEKYSRAQEIKNTRKMREILDELPRFCRQYFRGIEESTGARTRLAYAYDLRIFFEFIESENSAMKGTAIRDYPVSILEQIGKEDIEEFLEYLTYYEKDGQVFTNDARGKARKLSAVRSMFKYFYTSEILSRDVSALVPLPKLHEKPIIRLDADEVNDMLNKADTGSQLTKNQ